MLFTSPLFLFIFLPLTLGIYALIPTDYRKKALLIISVSFYLMNTIYNLAFSLIFALAIVITLLCAEYIKLTKSKLFLYMGIATAISIFVYYGVKFDSLSSEKYRFPLGAAIYSLAMISYLIDTYKNESEIHLSTNDKVLYFLFFPTIIAGPIIKYRDFSKMINLCEFDLLNMVDGAKTFVIGFLKKVIIASTLSQISHYLSNYSNNYIDAYISIGILLISIFQGYYELSGYSDMGRGIARMFGYKLERDYHNPLIKNTVKDYQKSFFRSLYLWLNEYLYKNIVSFVKSKHGLSGNYIALLITSIVYTLYFNIKINMVVAGIFIFLFTIVTEEIKQSELYSKFYAKAYSYIITLTCVLCFWMLIRFDNIPTLVNTIISMEVSPTSHQLLPLLASILNLKNITVILCAFLFILPVKEWGNSIISGGTVKAELLHFSYNIVLWFLFFISIIYFLPQHQSFSVRAFQFFAF